MHNIKRSGLLLVSLLSLLLFVLPQKGIAQTYPVQTNAHLVAPYGKHLNDYYATTNEKLIVTLLNKDQLKPTMEVRLRMTITASNGLKIQSKEGVNYPTINLDAGIPTRLSHEDLMPYFTNIISSGYFDQGKLPDGQVEFSFQAIEQYTGKVLSAPGTARAWLTTQKPPVLQLPSNDEWLAFSEHMHLKFQWTPQHKNISQVEYQFQLRELPDYGVAPQSSFLYAPVIYEDRLLYTNLIYDVMMPPLEPNKLYGWRVQAIAKDGVDELSLFENNGFSEVFWFRTGDNCPPPIGVQATVQDRKVNLTWVADLLNNEFVVQYRPKYGTADQDWKEVKSFEPQATLYDINRGTTYEYRVGAICTSGNPFYSVIGEVSVPKVDSTRLLNCGVPPILHLENQDRLPELKVGDVVHLSDYPMTVTKASGSNGSFTGEGWVPMNWLLETKWAVEFNNISVNTDYKLIGGSVRAKYDEKEGNIANIDHITEGGGDNTREGIVKVVKLNIVIPPDPVFKYDEAKEEVIVFDSNNQSQPVPLPKDGNGKVVFPVIVQDRGGNIHKIDVPRDSEGNPIVDSDGNPQKDKDGNVILESTHLGNQSTPLSKDSFDPKGLSSNVAVITFERGAGKYAFDTWIKGYENISKIKPHYERLASGDKDYHIPWKLLPEGESDVVKATIEISKDNKEKDFDPEKVVFATLQGTRYNAKYENNTYNISLVAGEPNDIQEIYALYPIQGSTEQFHTLGKLNVITYKKQEHKLVIVQVNGNNIDKLALTNELNQIYNQVGVNWTVEQEDYMYSGETSGFFDKGSKFLSSYNGKMQTLQNTYKEDIKGLDGNTFYVFILADSGDGKNRDTQGFMPKGSKFAYIFKNNIKKGINQVIAHELGHGVWKLSHTFDSTYGSEFKETDTDNLMSYSGGSHIAKWQWDVIDEPAWFTNPLDGDEKGMKVDEALNIEEQGSLDVEDPQIITFYTSKKRYVLELSKKIQKFNNNTLIDNGETFVLVTLAKDDEFVGFYEKTGYKNLEDKNGYVNKNSSKLKLVKQFNSYKLIKDEILQKSSIELKEALLTENNPSKVDAIITLRQALSDDTYLSAFNDGIDDNCRIDLNIQQKYLDECLDKYIVAMAGMLNSQIEYFDYDCNCIRKRNANELLGNSDKGFQKFFRDSVGVEGLKYIEDEIYEKTLLKYKDNIAGAIYGKDENGIVNIPQSIKEKVRREAREQAFPSVKVMWAIKESGADPQGMLFNTLSLFSPDYHRFQYYRALAVTDRDEAVKMVSSIGLEVALNWAFEVVPAFKAATGKLQKWQTTKIVRNDLVSEIEGQGHHIISADSENIVIRSASNMEGRLPIVAQKLDGVVWRSQTNILNEDILTKQTKNHILHGEITIEIVDSRTALTLSTHTRTPIDAAIPVPSSGVNVKVKATGIHSERALVPGKVEKIANTEQFLTTLSTGENVYKCKIKVFVEEMNNGRGGWVTMGNEKTLFPSSWSNERILSEISEAYNNRVLMSGVKYQGVTSNGTKIEMYIDGTNGVLRTAYIIE